MLSRGALEPLGSPLRPLDEGPETFLPFATDDGAREHELSDVTAYSLTLRYGDPDNNSGFYTTSVLKAHRDERHALCETLHPYPERAPRTLRE